MLTMCSWQPGRQAGGRVGQSGRRMPPRCVHPCIKTQRHQGFVVVMPQMMSARLQGSRVMVCARSGSR